VESAQKYTVVFIFAWLSKIEGYELNPWEYRHFSDFVDVIR